MGYREVGMVSMGSFQVEEVHFIGLTEFIILIRTSAGATSALKEHTIGEYKGKTLGDISADLPKRGGFDAAVHPDLAPNKIEERHIRGSPNQTIQDLARYFGAVA